MNPSHTESAIESAASVRAASSLRRFVRRPNVVWAAALAGLGVVAACSSSSAPAPSVANDSVPAASRHGRGDLAATSWPVGATATIWETSFEHGAIGNVHSLTSVAPQLALSRASVATVQTSASTVDTSPAVDDARIGNPGTLQGLLVEESRTNYAMLSRAPASWAWVQAGTTITPAYAPGPDGTANGSRIQIPANTDTGVIGWLEDTAPGNVYTYSEWLRATNTPTPGGPIVQWGACDNAYDPAWADPAPTTQWQRSVLAPLTQRTAQISAMAPAFSNPYWCGAYTNTPMLKIDQVVDMMQAELASFATEAITTQGGTATRAGDHLSIRDGASAVDGGQLSLYLKMYPKGDAVAYGAPVYFFSIDANNYALFNPKNQTVSIAVNGVVVSSAPVTAAAGGVVQGLFRAQQAVEWFISAGAGAGLVQYRVNGGAMVTLLDQPLTGTLAPTGGIDLLSSGTSSQFTSWLADVAVYRNGQGGLTGGGGTASTCTPTAPSNGAVAFSSQVGRLTLKATSTVDAAGATTTSWAVSSDTGAVLTGLSEIAQGVTTTEIDYGAPFHGIAQAAFTSDGTTVTGSINGRALVPQRIASPTPQQFTDNGAMPAVTVDPGTLTDVYALLDQAHADVPNVCAGAAGTTGAAVPPAIASLASSLWHAPATATSAPSPVITTWPAAPVAPRHPPIVIPPRVGPGPIIEPDMKGSPARGVVGKSIPAAFTGLNPATLQPQGTAPGGASNWRSVVDWTNVQNNTDQWNTPDCTQCQTSCVTSPESWFIPFGLVICQGECYIPGHGCGETICPGFGIGSCDKGESCCGSGSDGNSGGCCGGGSVCGSYDLGVCCPAAYPVAFGDQSVQGCFPAGYKHCGLPSELNACAADEVCVDTADSWGCCPSGQVNAGGECCAPDHADTKADVCCQTALCGGTSCCTNGYSCSASGECVAPNLGGVTTCTSGTLTPVQFGDATVPDSAWVGMWSDTTSAVSISIYPDAKVEMDINTTETQVACGTGAFLPSVTASIGALIDSTAVESLWTGTIPTACVTSPAASPRFEQFSINTTMSLHVPASNGNGSVWLTLYNTCKGGTGAPTYQVRYTRVGALDQVYADYLLNLQSPLH